MQPALSKHELKRVIQQFLKDPNRGISIRLFAELAGMSQGHLQDVFLYQTEPVSETVQRRVDKAYKAYINGEVVTIDGGEWLQGAGEFNMLEQIPTEMWDMLEMMIKNKGSK